MADCLFCRIVAGDIPASFVHQDDDVIAFSDINPQAPLHLLIVPTKHIATLNDLKEEDAEIVGDMVRLAARIAAERGYAQKGYRTVFNCNSYAGQSIYHIHMHMLAGRHMGWPPG